jgi:hypothetical protein
VKEEGGEKGGRSETATYKVIALPTIDKAVHDSNDLEPKIQQLFTAHITEKDEVMQIHFAQQCGGADSRLAHPSRITLIYLWLEQLGNERHEDFAEDSGPLFVVWGGEMI